MKHWIVKNGGLQGMILAGDINKANEKAYGLFGSLNIDSVKEATEEEVDWHKAMNGAIY